MTWEHERVEELLAAHALGGLESEDAQLAERALVEHVPGCARCRKALDEYRRVAGELALLATPVEPPETVAARLRRSTGGGRRPPLLVRRAAVAVVVMAAVALGGWNVALVSRLERAEVRQGWIADAVSTVAQQESSAVPLRGSMPARVTMVQLQGQRRLYLIGTNLREPRGVYRVWLAGRGGKWSPGTLTVERGMAMMPVDTDLSRWDMVMITEEPERDRPMPQASPLMSARVTSDSSTSP